MARLPNGNQQVAGNNFQANNGVSGQETYPPQNGAESFPPTGNGFQDPSAVQGTPVTRTPTQQQPQQGKFSAPAVYPPRSPVVGPIGRPWKSSLFDFGNDVSNALMTTFLPCITYGQIAEMLDEGQISCVLASAMYALFFSVASCSLLSTNYRRRLRMKFNLVQAPAEDCFVHLFFPFCALCQEYRELKARGLDPSLGWMGYLASNQEREMAMNPPADQAMNRQ